jgi:hypothetical protein
MPRALSAAPVAIVMGLAWLMTVTMTLTYAVAARSAIVPEVPDSRQADEGVDKPKSAEKKLVATQEPEKPSEEELPPLENKPLTPAKVPEKTLVVVDPPPEPEKPKKPPAEKPEPKPPELVSFAGTSGDVLVVVVATDALLRYSAPSAALRAELDSLMKSQAARLVGGDVWLCDRKRLTSWNRSQESPADLSNAESDYFKSSTLPDACVRIEQEVAAIAKQRPPVRVVIVWFSAYKPTKAETPSRTSPMNAAFIWAGLSDAQQKRLTHVTDLFRATYPQDTLEGLAATVEQAIADGE